MASRRKLENAALILPMFGAALIVPPLINVFNVPRIVFGMPAEVVYLFGIWIGLVVLTAVLGHRLRDEAEPEKTPPGGTGEDSGR